MRDTQPSDGTCVEDRGGRGRFVHTEVIVEGVGRGGAGSGSYSANVKRGMMTVAAE